MRPSPADRERCERGVPESRVRPGLSRVQETIPITDAGHQHVDTTASQDASAGLGAGGNVRISAVPGRTHLLTVALEDYYHNFGRVIARSHWNRFEKRVERSTTRALDLLDEFGIRATFFTLGWVASTLPELVREVARRGHEIASKGYHQRNLREMSPTEFRDDLARSREALEHASGQRVVGYRAPGWLKPSDVWALEVLAEEGYRYDSSVKPLLFRFHGEPSRRLAHEIVVGERRIWEFPISTLGPEGLAFPIGAGNYFRQLPESMVRRAVARWERQYSGPFTMYFHTWELDPDQPQITAAPLIARIRYYRHLDRFADVLRYYLARYRFTGIRDYLGISPENDSPENDSPENDSSPDMPDAYLADLGVTRSAVTVVSASIRPPDDSASAGPRTPVTVVIPCFNEEHTLPYLANTLESVEQTLADRYELEFVFVDDRSTDDTWGSLTRLFGDKANCQLMRHPINSGVAIGILTGIRAATTEIVASIDCDCTYDPHELGNMLALLRDDVDMITGSPYHPEGSVRNVPAWRLSLSKGASALYRQLLHQKLGTYTSCFRIYRRSRVLNMHLTRGGFLGIAEMMGKLDLNGSKIVEYPTTLNVRVLGYSKMKVMRTITGHLGLMLELLWLRAFGERPAGSTAAPAQAPVEGRQW